MPDNKSILIHKIIKATTVYAYAYLETLDNSNLLDLWLRISKPIKQPRANKLILQEVTV
jgi:hypothetical protein